MTLPASSSADSRTRAPQPRELDRRAGARRIAERTIAAGSKSFALASRVLPPQKRLDAWLLYSWCRHADDVIDRQCPEARPEALATLRDQVESFYDDRPLSNPLWDALREVLERRRIPKEYLSTLLDGMQMDVERHAYRTTDELLLYCHRVAGVVGLMMVQILGIDRRSALRAAAQLGLAMQLTNIARDVLEDWNDGRLYLPDEWLNDAGIGDLRARLGEPFPAAATSGVAAVVERMLILADQFYRTSDTGLVALDPRSALAVRTARAVYSEIGQQVRARRCDVTRGRAVVSTARKIALLGKAVALASLELPRRLALPRVELPVERLPRFPEDVLP
ncbi:MAG: phytoene/squalene synthase family protein [Polyangiaceae bacterium]